LDFVPFSSGEAVALQWHLYFTTGKWNEIQ